MVDAVTVSTSQCVNVLHPALCVSSVSPQAKPLQVCLKWFPFSLPAETAAGEGKGHFR